jgi:hypothetical protein
MHASSWSRRSSKFSGRGSPAWRAKKMLPALDGSGWIRSYTFKLFVGIQKRI